MATTNLNISVVEKRMMNPTEAAHYCGLAIKHFKVLCPVQPVALQPSSPRYDKSDLDKWLDDLKSGSDSMLQSQIVERL